jgi:hypothetical protein
MGKETRVVFSRVVVGKDVHNKMCGGGLHESTLSLHVPHEKTRFSTFRRVFEV